MVFAALPSMYGKRNESESEENEEKRNVQPNEARANKKKTYSKRIEITTTKNARRGGNLMR